MSDIISTAHRLTASQRDAALERLTNDRFGPELSGHGMHPEREAGYRQGWNDCADNIRRILLAVTVRCSFSCVDGKVREL